MVGRHPVLPLAQGKRIVQRLAPRARTVERSCNGASGAPTAGKAGRNDAGPAGQNLRQVANCFSYMSARAWTLSATRNSQVLEFWVPRENPDWPS